MALKDCVAGGRAWRDGEVVDVEITSDEITAVVAEDGTMFWVDLLRPSVEEIAELAARLDLPPTTVEDATGPLERPKVTQHGSTVFFTVKAVSVVDPSNETTRGSLKVARLSGILTPRGLVTIRLDEDLDPQPIANSWDENPELLKFGPWALLHGALDAVVDGYFQALQHLDTLVENLEDQLFSDVPPGREFTAEMFRLRKDIVLMRRCVTPMRDVVAAVIRFRPRDHTDLDHWYDDLYDHTLRTIDETDTMRDLVGTMYETNINLQDSRLNVIMKKLAGWGAIIAVPTAITGWYGQNVPYPGVDHPIGVWTSIILIVVGSGALYTAFKARDWL